MCCRIELWKHNCRKVLYLRAKRAQDNFDRDLDAAVVLISIGLVWNRRSVTRTSNLEHLSTIS